MNCNFLTACLLILLSNLTYAFVLKYYPALSSVRLSDVVSENKIDTDVLPERVINISPKAMSHILNLQKAQSDELSLRMGIRAGGCSGMSYVMDMIPNDQIQEDDHVEIYEGIRCVVDPKSLLYLFGLQLDYSDELIGGGFKFINPNAETSCGCGKSFNV
jgi:iron-sulfur cluster assembly protein